jgi:hypothetical protein
VGYILIFAGTLEHLPKKAPEALKSKASGCGSKTEKRWNKVEQ